jgi:hypothetical protein
LIGEDRKWRAGRQNGAIDPQETLAGSKSRNARLALRAPIWTCCPVVTPPPSRCALLLAHVIVHNAHDPATMAAALALTVDQDDADLEPGKRGNQRDTLAQ